MNKDKDYREYAELFTIADSLSKQSISRTMWLLVMGLIETWDMIE